MPIKTISQELVLEISRGYPDLKLLNLSNNEISVVENLAPLTALERLNLTGPAARAHATVACGCRTACSAQHALDARRARAAALTPPGCWHGQTGTNAAAAAPARA
jgi:hypothetical protein